MATQPAPSGARGPIPGLDAIRFAAAAIVALGHFPADYAAELAFVGPDLAKPIGGFLGVAFDGPAAVIVVFILSGLVRIVQFHAPGALASDVFTLTLFAIPATWWIAVETRCSTGRTKPGLDRLGIARYSLHLVHPLAMLALTASAGRRCRSTFLLRLSRC